MSMQNDTICAISTPPGVGGIAVARISGPEAISIADKIWRGKKLAAADTHTAHLGTLIDRQGQPLDQAVATVFRSPTSFTGEDTVELSVHGSRYVQRELLDTLAAAGARLAEPGEFTRRAFAAGRMDLAEAEAVADVIAADSRAAHRIAISQMKGDYSRRLSDLRSQLLELASLLELELDFSEEDVEFASRTKLLQLARETQAEIERLHRSFAAGQAIRDGIPVAIVGATNAGKSSLLNTLLGDNRAIVSDIHGTTRDTIEEVLPLGDFTFRFIDTAGLRNTDNPIEQAGIERSHQALERCRIAILVIDPTEAIDGSMIRHTIASTINRSPSPAHIILAVNKADIAPETASSVANAIKETVPDTAIKVITISAANGIGIDTLKDTLVKLAETDRGNAGEDILVTNLRHARALAEASAAMSRVVAALSPQQTLLADTTAIPGDTTITSGKKTVIPEETTVIPSVTTVIPGDLIAIDLREAIHHLSAITGEITAPDILATIFSRFCIGK